MYDDDEDDESSVGSRGNSRPGSKRGSRSNTPKRDSRGGRQSLEKGVMEKALLAKGKKGAAGKTLIIIDFFFSLRILKLV